MPATMVRLAPSQFTRRVPRAAPAIIVRLVGRKAKPVTSGEKPRTCCIYRAKKKMGVLAAAANATVTRFAPVSVRRRKMCRGTSGWATCVSMKPKVSKSARARASSPTVQSAFIR